MRTQAILVGVDVYAGYAKPLEGPCAGAVAMASWLLALDDPDIRIDMFLAPGPDVPGLAALLANPAVTRHEASYPVIFHFLTEELSSRKDPGRLFIYWCGHGFVSSSTDHRHFICSDYADVQANTFDMTNYLRQLRTEDFRHYESQICLADVCGVFKDPIRESTEKRTVRKVPQLAYFASVPGHYVRTQAVGGDFTMAALKALKDLGTNAFDHALLRQGMASNVASLNNTAYEISGWMDDRELILTGNASPALEQPHLVDAITTLTAIADIETRFVSCYQRTAAALSIPASAGTVRDALTELANMRDVTEAKPISAGLLEFMMRMERQQGIKKAARSWLKRHAGKLTASRAKITDKLDAESKERILLIKVESTNRDITSFSPFLCSRDGALADRTLATQAVNGWDDLVSKLQRLFAEVAPGEQSLGNLQIHFAVDTPLFDCPFHTIPFSEQGMPIGTMTVVLLRYIGRLRSRSPQDVSRWREYFNQLRAAVPAGLQWQPFGVGNASTIHPNLFFPAPSLPAPSSIRPPCEFSKHVLRILNLGVPCMYLPHTNLTERDNVQAALTAWPAPGAMENLAPLFYGRVLSNEPLASNGSLFWDDPECIPLQHNRGVNDQ